MINMKKVLLDLFKDTGIAMNNIYRYECPERIALRQVLTAAIKDEPIDKVFIQCAQVALTHSPVNKSQIVA